MNDGEGDENESLDKQNMDFMKAVANQIHPCIQMTTDYPSKNPGGKMPIPDLSVSLASMFDSVTHNMNATLLHEPRMSLLRYMPGHLYP